MTEKVYIDNSNMATFVCPRCQKAKTVDVSNYKDIETSVRVKCKCPCGNTYSVLLERRKYYRKYTNLPGTYITMKGNHKGLMVVTDLSRTGLRFRLNGERMFDIGDKIIVEFNLDDKLRTQIKKSAVIQNIAGPSIGAEYTSVDHFDKLGPYLLK